VGEKDREEEVVVGCAMQSGRARFLNLHTPGGFERYIRELTAMRSRGETPTDEFFRSHDQYNV